MPIIRPFHALTEDFFHNNSDCTEGAAIKPEDLKRGTGGKQLCEICKRLTKADPVPYNDLNVFRPGKY